MEENATFMGKKLIIVPAYNEAENIEKTINDIVSHTNYDYVIVDDSSNDHTKEVCRHNGFNILSLPVNYGLTSGVQLGMKYAYKKGYDIAIQFDGDGQHKAKYLPALVAEIEKGTCDVAIGSRYATVKRPKNWRMLGSRLISWGIKVSTLKTINDPTSGMRAYNKQIIKEFNEDASLTPEPDTLVYLLKKGKRILEIQVDMDEREFGESYLTPFKSMEYMIHMFFMIIFIRAFTRGRK